MRGLLDIMNMKMMSMSLETAGKDGKVTKAKRVSFDECAFIIIISSPPSSSLHYFNKLKAPPPLTPLKHHQQTTNNKQ
jgi:hypothetical protein